MNIRFDATRTETLTLNIDSSEVAEALGMTEEEIREAIEDNTADYDRICEHVSGLTAPGMWELVDEDLAIDDCTLDVE